MQLAIAFGALALGVEARDKHRATIGTSRACDRAYHPGRPRAQMIASAARAALRRFALMPILLLVLLLLFRLVIAAMAVLAIHKCLRPSASTDCYFHFLHH